MAPSRPLGALAEARKFFSLSALFHVQKLDDVTRDETTLASFMQSSHVLDESSIRSV